MAGRGGLRLAIPLCAAALVAAAGWALLVPASADAPPPTLTGAAAFGDWHADKPGLRRLIRPGDLPPPFATRSASNGPDVTERPTSLVPKVPPGFTIAPYAAGLDTPRMIRLAPNGDVLVAESAAGRVHLFRGPDGAGRPTLDTIFAAHLNQPFGIAFYPPGPSPQFVYVADTDAILRFPYANGDTEVRRDAVTVIAGLPVGGHWTRDIAFSPDGKTMYVTVGSGSNDAEGLRRLPPDGHRRPRGRARTRRRLGPRGPARRRAGHGPRWRPRTHLRHRPQELRQPGDPARHRHALVRHQRARRAGRQPAARLRDAGAPGAFYGWPWYYIGDHEDPAHKGERPDLAGKVTVPDVLLQPHSAPLGMTFYTGAMFPAEYRGDAFVALQGSWNRAKRTGYKLARIPLKDGAPTGEYEDFMTGLVASDDAIYGRPVAVVTAQDGALLLTDEVEGIIWRISYGSKRHRPSPPFRAERAVTRT